MKRKLLKATMSSCLLMAVHGISAADLYMSPDGAGSKDGANWENALSYNADKGSLEEAWDDMGKGSTLHLAAGDYKARPVTLFTDGKNESEMRTLKGHVKDGKRPTFTGNWAKEDKSGGQRFLGIKDGSTWWTVKGITIKNCRDSVIVYGPSSNGILSDIRVEESRDSFIIFGGSSHDEDIEFGNNILIENCTAYKYTKRGFRIRYGANNITLKNCMADAGGKEWYVEPFPIGFNVGSRGDKAGCHDITFIDCLARNNYHPKGDKFWNADGFCAESEAYNLTYIGCESYDNTDGGWDDKTPNPLLIGCVSMRNKKNFRFWAGNPGVMMVNSVSSNPIKRGGNSEATAVWIAGKLRAENCTFIGGGYSLQLNDWGITAEQYAKLGATLTNCTLTVTPSNRDQLANHKGVVLNNSLMIHYGNNEGNVLNGKCPELLKSSENIYERSSKGHNSSWITDEMIKAARLKQPLLKNYKK